MTQTWHDLLFAHWPLEAAVVRALVPPQLPLDTFDGRAWIGIVPFTMSRVGPRFVPALPWLSAFPEINVRTYVTVGGRPGVYFFSLDATNPVAVRTARLLYRLPYFTASIAVAREGDRIVYRSRRRSRPDAAFDATYAPSGPAFQAQDGSLDYFLTERYCLYTAGHRVSRTDIHHPRWTLQRAEAEIRAHTIAAAAGLPALPAAPHLLFSRRQDTVAWLPTRVTMPPITEAP